MDTSPINLAIRFLLEIVMLIKLAWRGGHLFDNWLRFISMTSLPIAAAALWGIFRMPNDPKLAQIAIPVCFDCYFN